MHNCPIWLSWACRQAGVEAAAILKALAARAYSGEVLLLGPRSSPVVAAVQELGEQLDLAMLPVLATPFGIEGLRDSVATLLPTDAPPEPLQSMC